MIDTLIKQITTNISVMLCDLQTKRLKCLHTTCDYEMRYTDHASSIQCAACDIVQAGHCDDMCISLPCLEQGMSSLLSYLEHVHVSNSVKTCIECAARLHIDFGLYISRHILFECPIDAAANSIFIVLIQKLREQRGQY